MIRCHATSDNLKENMKMWKFKQHPRWWPCQGLAFVKIWQRSCGESLINTHWHLSHLSPNLAQKLLFVLTNGGISWRHIYTKEQTWHGEQTEKGLGSLNLSTRSGDQEDLLSDCRLYSKSAAVNRFLLSHHHNIRQSTSLIRTSQRRRKPGT